MNNCFSIIFKGKCEKLEENLAKREKQMSLSLAIIQRNPIILHRGRRQGKVPNESSSVLTPVLKITADQGVF